MNGEDRLSQLLDKIVNQAFTDSFGQDLPDDLLSGSVPAYASKDEYKQRTGRRFRMTKVQKDKGLTTEQAFSEFQLTLSKKKK
jgi:hypothetical protein